MQGLGGVGCELLKNPQKLKIVFLIKGNIGIMISYSFGILKQIVVECPVSG